jgi:site-specific recombinase XerD
LELPRKITRDPDNVGHVTIIGKGRKRRTVGLNHKACQALKSYLDVRAHSDYAHLFLTKYRKPMSKRSIEKMLTKYLAQAHIRNASVHTLRHTFGTHHVKNGTPLPVVRDIMGHSNVAVTSVYLSTAQADRNRSLPERAL